MPTSRPQSNVAPIGADSGSGSDGGDIDDNDILADQGAKTGIYALNRVDLFNLLCIPPLTRDSTSLPSNWTATSANVYQNALKLCVDRRAMLIVDPDPAWATSINRAIENAIDGRNDLNLSGTDARNAALYFPCVREVDPLRDSRVDTFVPSGIIAGIMARTDVARGVWKAPAGLDASLNGVQDLQVNLSDLENGELNPLGINCLRSMGVNGRVVWGARTLRGADENADEYKYVPVRRLALFLEESLYRGTQWVVFEPNDEPLWAQVRLNVGAFMQGLFRQGAFQGTTPKDAYFVKCDSQTTTQNDINLGILNVIVGFAPLKPAEFVIISIQQMAGQIQT
jgi:phage tail sheath protein FI